MTRKSIALFIAGLALALSVQAQYVYRWVDENGQVQYGPALPPNHGNKPYDILNEQGMLIERVDNPLERQQRDMESEESTADSDKLEPLFSEDEVRLRSDRLLVLKYHSEEDINEAMEIEVAQLDYDARLIRQSQSSVISTIAAQVKNAADRQRAGMPADENMEKEIQGLRQRLRRSEGSLAELKSREDRIRANFQKEIERYRYLQGGGAPGSIAPTQETGEDQETPGSP